MRVSFGGIQAIAMPRLALRRFCQIPRPSCDAPRFFLAQRRRPEPTCAAARAAKREA